MYNLDPASDRTDSAQAFDLYGDMKCFGNYNKDSAQRYYSLYESIACAVQVRSLAGSRYEICG
jgi:hypothetical protein